MKLAEKVRDEKLQYHTNREAVKISELPSSNIDKNESNQITF